jgi:hypothetical protein
MRSTKEERLRFDLGVIRAYSTSAIQSGATEAEILLAVRAGISTAWSGRDAARREKKVGQCHGLRLVQPKKGGRQ